MLKVVRANKWNAFGVTGKIEQMRVAVVKTVQQKSKCSRKLGERIFAWRIRGEHNGNNGRRETRQIKTAWDKK